MTKYVQLRDSGAGKAFDLSGLVENEVVESVAYALFSSWFPRFPESGPFGADLDNWKTIAVEDARVAIGRMRDLGLLIEPNGAMVEATTNDDSEGV